MKKMESYKIYCIYLKPENNKVVYVGMTAKHPVVRLYQLGHDNNEFIKLKAKYGPDCFGYKIIEFIDTKEEAFIREAYWTGVYGGVEKLINKGVGSNSTASMDKQQMRDFYDKTLRLWIKKNEGPHTGKGLKPVRCLETDKVYCSIVDASKQTGIPSCSIVNACRGRTATARGYTWKYVEGDEI